MSGQEASFVHLSGYQFSFLSANFAFHLLQIMPYWSAFRSFLYCDDGVTSPNNFQLSLQEHEVSLAHTKMNVTQNNYHVQSTHNI